MAALDGLWDTACVGACAATTLSPLTLPLATMVWVNQVCIELPEPGSGKLRDRMLLSRSKERAVSMS
jgi:hypothetical protein